MYSEFNNYGANATPVMMDCPEAPKQLEELRPNGVIAELRNVDFGAFAQQAPIHNVPNVQNMHSVDGMHGVMQPNIHSALQHNGDVRTQTKTELNASQPKPTVSAVKKTKKKQNESIGWPEKDLCELFMRIESVLPIDDKLTYKSRVDKLDWNVIAFNNYSSEDCKQVWCLVQKKMRRYRVLREILTDAKEWIGIQPKQAAKRMKIPNKTNNTPPKPVQIYQAPPQQLPLQQLPPQLLQKLPPQQQLLPPPPPPPLPQQLPPQPPPPPPDTKTHKEKRSHKRKHPDMPKPALSAYKIFYRDKKDVVIAQNPGIDPHAIGKLITQLFKTLPPEIKEAYEKQSQEMHREYESKLAAFNQAHPELAVVREEKSPKTPKMAASTSTTKKPVTPFGLYYADQLNSDDASDRHGFRNACKAKWKGLPDKEKMVWIEKALEEERKMLQQQEQQQEQQPQEQQQDAAEPSTSTPIKHCLTKKEQRIIERASGKPTKPPGSAYAVFTRMMLMSEEIKCIHHRNRLSVISDQWKALSEADKQLYKDRADAMADKYKKDLAVYLDSLPEDKRNEEMEAINAAALKRMNSKRTSRLKSRAKAKLKRQSSSSTNDDPNKPKKVRSESSKRVFRAGVRTSMRHKNPPKSEPEEFKTEIKTEDKDKDDEANTEKTTKKEGGEENVRESQDDVNQPDETEDKKSSEETESEDEDKPKEEPESELMSRFKGQPKKPPATGFALFCSTYKGQQKRRNAWKRLGQIRRDRYELQLQILKREYIAEYAAFLKSLTKEELHEFAKLNLQQKKE